MKKSAKTFWRNFFGWLCIVLGVALFTVGTYLTFVGYEKVFWIGVALFGVVLITGGIGIKKGDNITEIIDDFLYTSP